MFSSFKNIELSRYSLSANLSKVEENLIKQNSSNVSLLAGSIFSGAFSVLATYASIKYSSNFTWKIALLNVIVFSISFIISFYIYKIFCFIAKLIKNTIRKENLASTPSEIKQIIDDFDHIACDNILVAYEFQKSFESEPNINVANYYYHEIVYYLKVSIDKTSKVMENGKNCLNTLITANKVDLFRVENLLDMMSEIYNFLNRNDIKSKIVIDPKLRSSFDSKISNIKVSIDNLKDSCDTFKKENF